MLSWLREPYEAGSYDLLACGANAYGLEMVLTTTRTAFIQIGSDRWANAPAEKITPLQSNQMAHSGLVGITITKASLGLMTQM